MDYIIKAENGATLLKPSEEMVHFIGQEEI